MPEGGTDEALDPAPKDDGVVLVKPDSTRPALDLDEVLNSMED